MKLNFSSNKGSTLLEAAISFPIFVFIIFNAMDIAMLGFKASGLFYTLNTATRWAVLGNTDPKPQPDVGYFTRVESIERRVQSMAKAYGLNLTPDNINVCPLGHTSCHDEDAAPSGEYLQLTADVPQQIFMGLYTVNISYSVIGKNEHFSD